MAKVVLEHLVVDVVVTGRTQSESSEHTVPRQSVFGVDHGQPVGVHRPEGHVGPDVAGPYDVGRAVQRYEDHEDGIGQRSVEGIEHAGVGEAVVGLVRLLVDGRTETVLEHVHGVLDSVLDDEAGEQAAPLDGPLEGVVGLGHQVEHPRDGEVGHQQDEALGLGQVRLHPLGKVVRARTLGLDGHGFDTTCQVSVPIQIEEGQNKELSDRHGKDAESESQRLGLVGGWIVLVPVRREHFSVGGESQWIRQHQRKRQEERPCQRPRPRKSPVLRQRCRSLCRGWGGGGTPCSSSSCSCRRHTHFVLSRPLASLIVGGYCLRHWCLAPRGR